ncbi:MAG TPA: hypothetical protein VFG21_10980 [Xanthomonadaceae bacterium]|nr:hypothetical protein [Xanthomonadaceae bacterium]
MRTVLSRVPAAALLALAFSLPAAAAETPEPLLIEDVPQFLAVERERALKFERSDAYQDLPRDAVRRLEQAQRTLFERLEGHAHASELDHDERIAVFNAQETINAIYAQAEDQKLICERRRVVGSNIPQTVCITKAERDHHRQKIKNPLPRACAQMTGPGAVPCMDKN